MADAYGVGLAFASHQFVLGIVNAKQVGIVSNKGKRCICRIGGRAMYLSDRVKRNTTAQKGGRRRLITTRDFYTR